MRLPFPSGTVAVTGVDGQGLERGSRSRDKRLGTLSQAFWRHGHKLARLPAAPPSHEGKRIRVRGLGEETQLRPRNLGPCLT